MNNTAIYVIYMTICLIIVILQFVILCLDYRKHEKRIKELEKKLNE